MKSTIAGKHFSTATELRDWQASIAGFPPGKACLGFVPTMGALHAGHLALINKAVSQCNNVLVSIFVNPLQFGPGEDLDKYPQTLERDIELCRKAGVQAVYHPSVDEMYGKSADEITTVVPPACLTERLCGLFRPGHFTGVATVVVKLFNQIKPDIAYFGQKDYQQLTVVKRLVADLNLPVRIVSVPTVREADGLALSSRNINLTPEQRRLAPVLYQSLCFVQEQIRQDKMPLAQALAQARIKISDLKPVTLQYLEACHAETLEPLNSTGNPAGNPMVILIAARFDDVRLIDNLIVEHPP